MKSTDSNHKSLQLRKKTRDSILSKNKEELNVGVFYNQTIYPIKDPTRNMQKGGNVLHRHLLYAVW